MDGLELQEVMVTDLIGHDTSCRARCSRECSHMDLWKSVWVLDFLGDCRLLMQSYLVFCPLVFDFIHVLIESLDGPFHFGIHSVLDLLE